MRRILIVLVVLVVLAMISPALTGSIAAKQYRSSLELVEEKLPGLEFEEVSYDRGWFSSKTRQELVFTDFQIGEDGSVSDQHSGIFLDTEILHGPLIMGTGDPHMPALSFGAVITRTTVTFAADGKDPFVLPGGIYHHIAFNGDSSLRFIFDQVSQKFGEEDERNAASFTWDGAQIDIRYDAGVTHIESEGSISPLSIEAPDGFIRLGEIRLYSSADYTDFGIWVGGSSVDLAEIIVSGKGSNGQERVAITGMSVSSDVRLEEDRYFAEVNLDIADLDFSEMQNTSLNLEMSARDLDAATLGQIQQFLANGNLAGEDTAAVLTFELQQYGMTLLAKGLGLSISDLEVRTEQGDLVFALDIDIPESRLNGEAAAMNAMLSLSAKSTLRLDRSLYEHIARSNPLMQQQLDALLQSGMLIEEGERLVLSAEYGGGLLTVNGLPMPIPMVPQ